MKELTKLFILITLIFICILPGAFADKVYLQNGRAIEGIIQQETKGYITLDIGAGEITLPKSDIKFIEEYGSKKQKELKFGWSDKYFLNPEYVPEGLEDLASRFRQLSNLRQEAIESSAQRSTIISQIKEIQQETVQAKGELARISEILLSINPQENVNRYNKLVSKSNLLSSKIRLLTITEEKLTKKAAEFDKDTSKYINYLDTFKKEFNQEHQVSLDPDTQRGHFLVTIKKNLKGMGGDFIKHSTDYKSYRGNVIVEAVINDTQTVKLVVDTGASVVAISKDVIHRMGLDIENNPELTVVVADGRTVKAKQVVLESLRVGNAKVKNVFAAVLDKPTQGFTDGLLGMSFLSNFSLKLDSANNELVLEKFNPRK